MIFLISHFIELNDLLKKGGNKKLKNLRRNVSMLRVEIHVTYMIYLSSVTLQTNYPYIGSSTACYICD